MGGRSFRTLFDSGASRSIISLKVLNELPRRNIINIKKGTNNMFTDVQDNKIPIWGRVRFFAQFINNNNQYKNVEIIAQVVNDWKNRQLILGIDFLHCNNVEIMPRKAMIKIGKEFVIKYNSRSYINDFHKIEMNSISSDSSDEDKIYIRPKLLMQFGSQVYSVLLDTGATNSVISESVLSKLPGKNILKITHKVTKPMIDFQNNKVNVIGKVTLKTNIPGLNDKNRILKCTLQIVDNPAIHEIILGMDFLKTHNVILDLEHSLIKIGKDLIVPFRNSSNKFQQICLLTSKNDIKIPSGHVTQVQCRIHSTQDKNYLTNNLLVTPYAMSEVFQNNDNVFSVEHVIDKNSKVFKVPIINNSNHEVTIKKGLPIGLAEPATIQTVQKANYSLQHNDRNKTNFEMIKNIDLSHLTFGNKQTLLGTLEKFTSIMVEQDLDLTEAKVKPCHIDTGDAKPIRQKPYKMHLKHQEHLRKEIKSMLETGVILPSHSPWSSPIIYVQKKDTSLRLCVDYRKLNNVTKQSSYPLPNIETMLNKFNGATVFSKLDLKSGYWQVPMDKESQEKTAFICEEGLYQFSRMPFGITLGPSVFQYLMNDVLGENRYSFAFVYLDDILIFSKTFEEHIEHVKTILSLLQKKNLQIKPSKCEFATPFTYYLGYKISNEGIHTEEKKVETVKNFQVPATQKGVRSFLGLINYYSKFIPNLAEIAAPLYDLTPKGKKFLWSSECQKAFEILKKSLCTAPILKHPDLSKKFYLQSDASDKAIGAILLQEHKEILCPIGYYSRKLNKSQLNYSTIEKEMFAIVQAIKKWESIVYGSKIEIFTDHKSLEYIRTSPMKNRRVQYWSMYLTQFDYKIRHISGIKNFKADFLSRQENVPKASEYDFLHRMNAVQSKEDRSEITAEEVQIILDKEKQKKVDNKKIVLNAPDIFLKDISNDEHFVQLQKDDLELKPIRERIDESKYADFMIKNDNKLYHLSKASKKDNVQYMQLAIPKVLRKDIIKNIHEMGHFQTEKTYDNIRIKYWWPQCLKEVHKFIENCELCQRQKMKKAIQPLQELPLPVMPWELLGIDLVGPLTESYNGNKYIFTVIDHFSSWTEAFAIRDKEAETIAKVFMEELISRFSFPKMIISDRGSEFCNNILTELTKLFNVCKIKTSPYHPQCNGMIERFHRDLNSMLRKAADKNKLSWDTEIPQILLAYRTTTHSRTGHTPYFIMFGRDPIVPVDTILEPRRKYYGEDYLPQLLERQRKAWEMVIDNTKEMRQKNREIYDRKVKTQHLDVGDMVYYYSPHNRQDKLDFMWSKPYWRIIVKQGTVNYIIRNIETGEEKIVHANNLKLAHDNLIEQYENNLRKDNVAEKMRKNDKQPNKSKKPIVQDTKRNENVESHKSLVDRVTRSTIQHNAIRNFGNPILTGTPIQLNPHAAPYYPEYDEDTISYTPSSNKAQNRDSLGNDDTNESPMELKDDQENIPRQNKRKAISSSGSPISDSLRPSNRKYKAEEFNQIITPSLQTVKPLDALDKNKNVNFEKKYVLPNAIQPNRLVKAKSLNDLPSTSKNKEYATIDIGIMKPKFNSKSRFASKIKNNFTSKSLHNYATENLDSSDMPNKNIEALYLKGSRFNDDIYDNDVSYSSLNREIGYTAQTQNIPETGSEDMDKYSTIAISDNESKTSYITRMEELDDFDFVKETFKRNTIDLCLDKYYLDCDSELCHNGLYEISDTINRKSKLYIDFDYLSSFESEEIFNELMEDIEWENSCTVKKGKQYVDPRKIKLFSDIAYSYAGMDHVPTQAWPLCLENLKIKLIKEFQTPVNSCLCTLYNDENDSLGWHADDEEELGENPAIFSLSLGESRKFEMSRTIFSENENDCNKLKVNLTDGSLLVMLEATHKDWKHCIPKSNTTKGRRINLTFRKLHKKESYSQVTSLYENKNKCHYRIPPPTESDITLSKVNAWLNKHF